MNSHGAGWATPVVGAGRVRIERRDALGLASDLTVKQAAEDERMKLLRQWCDWAWEPINHEGPFDFGDPDYFRRGMTLYGELVKHRYIRTRPANTWMIKCIYGLRAMLANLKARVDIGAIFRDETTIT